MDVPSARRVDLRAVPTSNLGLSAEDDRFVGPFWWTSRRWGLMPLLKHTPIENSIITCVLLVSLDNQAYGTPYGCAHRNQMLTTVPSQLRLFASQVLTNQQARDQIIRTITWVCQFLDGAFSLWRFGNGSLDFHLQSVFCFFFFFFFRMGPTQSYSLVADGSLQQPSFR